MAIDPRISLGVQPLQIADPLAQYGQVQNILAAQAQQRSAGTQNELANVQLGQARLSLQQAQEAHDAVSKIMSTVQEHGGPADPMEAAMQMLRHPNPTVQATGGHLLDANQKLLAYQQQAAFLKDQTPNALTGQPEAAPAPQYQETPAFGVQGRAAPAEPAAAISTAPQNKLAPATAPTNAMAAPQEMTAQTLKSQINEGDRRYGAAPGWLKQRELLVDEYKQLIKPEFEFKEVSNPDGTISIHAINKRTAVSQPVMQGGTNQAVSSVNIPAQRLAFDKEVEEYRRKNPGKTIHSIVNDDQTTSLLAVDNKTGVAEKVTLDGSEVKGVDTAAQRLKWEKDHPGRHIQAVPNADGTTSYYSFSNRGGEPESVTMNGTPLVGAKVNAPPAMVAEYEFAKKPENGGFKGTFQQFVTSRAAAGRAPPQPSAPVAVVGADGKIKYVSREEAIGKGMTPASAQEGLPPKEIQKREASYPAATTSVKAIETKTDSLIKDLQTLRDHPGLDQITGIAAGRLPAVTANGRAAQALYDKIVAKGGFQVLQDMREASKTGGALGNISNQEGAQLKSAFAAIDRKQDAADVRRAIDEAISSAQGSKARVREAYNMTYEYKNQGGGGNAPSGAVDTNNPLLK